MNTVLVLSPYFFPARKAGGPVKSLRAMVKVLEQHVNVKVITSPRDVGCSEDMQGVAVNVWQAGDGCDVFYARSHFDVIREVLRLSAGCDGLVIYLNSLFSFKFSLVVVFLRKLSFLSRRSTVILAPRGELSPGALLLNSWKKKPFLALAKMVRLFDGLLWQATSQQESEDIRASIGSDALTKFASNISELVIKDSGDVDVKESGIVRVVFLSRISKKKNLLFALQVLAQSSSHIVFDIYGPAEDSMYWSECGSVISAMPSNVKVNYMGPVSADDVGQIYPKYDLFFLPTLGENFGHAIVEAMQSGCLVLLSDQTPWRDLASAGVGWDISLSNVDAFIAAVDHVAALDSSEMRDRRDAVRRYISSVLSSDDSVRQTLDLFGVRA